MLCCRCSCRSAAAPEPAAAAAAAPPLGPAPTAGAPSDFLFKLKERLLASGPPLVSTGAFSPFMSSSAAPSSSSVLAASGLKRSYHSTNAYFNARNFDAILSAPKEELHQFLFGLYGDHLLPATKYEIEKVLIGPDTIKSFNKNKDPSILSPRKCLGESGNSC